MQSHSMNLYGHLHEPSAEVHQTRYVALSVIDFLKNYLITFWEFPKIDLDQRLAIGSILIEYIFPLTLDDYIMEEQVLQFLYEVTMIKKPELKNLIFDLIEITLNSDQIKIFIRKLLGPLCKKIMAIELLGNSSNRKPVKKDFDMIYF